VLSFIWRTVVAGVLFLAPVLILLVIVYHAVRLLAGILTPVADHIPIQPGFGLDKPQIVAAIVLILIGFLAGLLAQMRFASRLTAALEQVILSKMPGYTLFKAVAQGSAGDKTSNLKVALANIDDAWLMAFVVEQHASGLLTVFVPSAPTPTAGSIYYLTEQQIKRLDVPVSEAVKCIMRLGVGSRELLERAGATKVDEKPRHPDTHDASA
jgi:uncharacterized membrane protein